jgi:hypothetical protein
VSLPNWAQANRHGFALVEMIIAVGVTALLFLAVTAFAMFCSRSFAALYNYVDLDDSNRVAIDQITRDVRESSRVSYYNTNGMAMTLQGGNGESIAFVFDPNAHTLTRTITPSGGNPEVTVLLKECDKLYFDIGQRNSKTGGYDIWDAASLDTAKVINVTWICSRSLFGHKANTESVQTARIVIRKQGAI